MKCTWQYTRKATKDLLALDQFIAKRIIKKVCVICSSAKPMNQAKPLTGIFTGLHRFRIGDYRVIFREQKNGDIIILSILRIKHRKDIYE